jgi:hypothetical protein
MNVDGLYKNHMGYIQGEEEKIIKYELQNTDSIAKQVVKAVEAKRPKHRYVAPKWQWFFLPIIRRLG